MSLKYLRKLWRRIFKKKASTTPKMVGWESLPLLALQRVLHHLELKDAVAAMSVCRHWRTASWYYEGRKRLLTLYADDFERNMYLARLFRKYVNEMHIYINVENGSEEWERFFDDVLPEFFDAVNLQAVAFIGPSHVNLDYTLSPAKLKRVVVESFFFKHIDTLDRFTLLGCEMDLVKDSDVYTHDKVSFYSSMLKFNPNRTEADRILTRCNTAHINYSNIQLIILNYEQATLQNLITLCKLPKLQRLTLTVTHSTTVKERIKWELLPVNIPVCITLLGIPERQLDYFIDKILYNVILLVSVKVIFCGTFYYPLITHLVEYHKQKLTEFVWIDAPHQPGDRLVTYKPLEPYQIYSTIYNITHLVEYHKQKLTEFVWIDAPHQPGDRLVTYKPLEADPCNINPLILLCWQCLRLKRLVIHGYWIWQYDVLGFLRLRTDLEVVELSSVYTEQNRFTSDRHVAVRVCVNDHPQPPSHHLIKQVSEFSSCRWRGGSGFWSEQNSERRARGLLAELKENVPNLYHI